MRDCGVLMVTWAHDEAAIAVPEVRTRSEQVGGHAKSKSLHTDLVLLDHLSRRSICQRPLHHPRRASPKVCEDLLGPKPSFSTAGPSLTHE